MRFNWDITADYDYASTQVNLPGDIAKRIMDWGKENIPDEEVFDEEDKGREDNPHITVLYGIVDNGIQPLSSSDGQLHPIEWDAATSAIETTYLMKSAMKPLSLISYEMAISASFVPRSVVRNLNWVK